MSSSSFPLNSSLQNVHRHLLITATRPACRDPGLLTWVMKAPYPLSGQWSYRRRLGCTCQKPALERGNFKGGKCVFYGPSAVGSHRFSMLEYAQVWIENEGNSILTKKLSFHRAILNHFHVPVVHVGTAFTGDMSNPNPRECDSISPEEELPGYFWVGKGPPSYCQALELSVSWGAIQALQAQPRLTLHRTIFELQFFRIKSKV